MKKFKDLLPDTNRPEIMEDILGEPAHLVQPPLSIDSLDESPRLLRRTRSADSDERRPFEQVLVAEGVHHDVDVSRFNNALKPDEKSTESERKNGSQVPGTHQSPKLDHPHVPSPRTTTSSTDHNSSNTTHGHGKGHAHDPLSDQLFLAVGPGGVDGEASPPDPPIVSESPPTAGINIYEDAYHKEVERIRRLHGEQATTYLTWRVESEEEQAQDEKGVCLGKEDGLDGGKKVGGLSGMSGLAKALQMVKGGEKDKQDEKETAGG